MGKDKKDKKEKKVVEEEPVVEKKAKKEKKDKKRKAEEAEPVVEDKKAAKKEKKEKKRKAEEEAAAAEATAAADEKAAKKEKKKAKKAKKSAEEGEETKEEEAVSKVSEENDQEAPMKVHKKEVATPTAAGDRPPGEPSLEVFMGNLSWQIDEASLQEAFKECGKIENCKWLEDRETGKFKGCGFITFKSIEEATKAVEMNGADVMGRPVKCNFSTPRAGGNRPSGGGGRGEVKPMQDKPDGCTTMFAGNLSFDIDDDQMKDFFKDCGEVSSIRWLTDKDSGQFKGCGFVEFSDPDAALVLAAKKNGETLLGRQIRLDYAAPRAPKW